MTKIRLKMQVAIERNARCEWGAISNAAVTFFREMF